MDHLPRENFHINRPGFFLRPHTGSPQPTQKLGHLKIFSKKLPAIHAETHTRSGLPPRGGSKFKKKVVVSGQKKKRNSFVLCQEEIVSRRLEASSMIPCHSAAWNAAKASRAEQPGHKQWAGPVLLRVRGVHRHGDGVQRLPQVKWQRGPLWRPPARFAREPRSAGGPGCRARWCSAQESAWSNLPCIASGNRDQRSIPVFKATQLGAPNEPGGP